MKRILHALTALLLASPAVLHAADAPRKLNFLFITADDMNHDSAGCYGCPQRDSPEILAAARQKLMDEYQRPRKAKAKANKRTEPRR